MSERFSSTPGAYPELDRFNRVIKDRWTRDLSTDRDIHSVDLSYDRNSNITWAEDNIYAGRDVLYTMDGLDRVADADEGTRSGGSIASRTRREQRTLSQAGNWATRMLDLDGDGAHSGAGELNDSGTFNAANELTARNTDSSGGDEFTLAHDAAGHLTDDGEYYKYTYDAWGRLRQVKNQSNALVIEHRYNGLGFRLGWHGDADADGTVESNSDDPWYFVTYDPSWRSVATFSAGDSDAKELFVPHASSNVRGLDGVILRDRDATGAWNAATDGTREERTYYCQNHRGDIVQLIWSTPWGVRRCESVRYSAFGVPTAIASGDFDGDGDEDSTDWQSLEDLLLQRPVPYIVTYDMDLDGDVDETDSELQFLTTGGGRGLLSTSAVGNRRGYAGYEHDWAIDSLCHVRNRAYLTDLGRWTRRDPLGYVEGMSLYAYVTNRAVVRTDGMGLLGGPSISSVDEGVMGPDDPNGVLGPPSSSAPATRDGCKEMLCRAGSPHAVGCKEMIFPYGDDCRRQSTGHCGSICSPLGGPPFAQAWCDNPTTDTKACCICDLQLCRLAPSSADLVAECIGSHEQVHLGQDLCEQNPSVGQSGCREVEAHTDSIACFRRQKSACKGDARCMRELSAFEHYSECAHSLGMYACLHNTLYSPAPCADMLHQELN